MMTPTSETVGHFGGIEGCEIEQEIDILTHSLFSDLVYGIVWIAMVDHCLEVS